MALTLRESITAKSLMLGFALLWIPVSKAQIAAPVGSQQSKSPQELSTQFRQGFLKGCMNGSTQGKRNQVEYCTCLANAYQSRYDGPTLAYISQLAAKSNGAGPALVNAMMLPESRRCTASK